MANARTGPSITTAAAAHELLASNIATDPEYVAGSRRWREVSAALHSRLRNSIADAQAELVRLYPTTFGDYVLRPAAYVAWLSRQHGDTYSREPEIELVDPDTGKRLKSEEHERYQRIRADARTTEAILSAHEEAIACGNGTVWVEPVIRSAPGGAQLLSVRHRSVPAHDQAVVLEQDRASTDERDVATWLVRMPIPGTSRLYGIARITPNEAVWEQADGGLSGQPIWARATAAAASNPIGDIPVGVLRWSDPDTGCFWANAREELLWQARAVDHGYTQAGETEVVQGHGQWWEKGLRQDAGSVKMGRRTMLSLDDSPNAQVGNVSPRPDLAGALSNLEGYLRVSVASQDANPATLIRSTAITAQGKEVELDDRAGLRRRHHMQLARLEQRLYDLTRAWLHALRGAEVLPAARLVVRYPEPRVPQNPLQEAQAAKMWVELGQEDPYTLYARMHGVPLLEAQRIVDQHFANSQRLGVVAASSRPVAQATPTDATPGDHMPADPADPASA